MLDSPSWVRSQTPGPRTQPVSLPPSPRSATPRAWSAVPVHQPLPHELVARHHRAAGVTAAGVREVAVVVGDSDDAPDDRGDAVDAGTGESNDLRRCHGVPPQSPGTGTASNGASDDTAGLWPRSTAVHSRTLSARITTTATMKKAVTPASR